MMSTEIAAVVMTKLTHYYHFSGAGVVVNKNCVEFRLGS